MAKMGMFYPVVAHLDETGGVPTYAAGRVIGEAMTANTTIETYEVPLYGDGRVVELVKGFKSGKTTFGTTEVSDEDAAYLLGHAQVDATLDGEPVKELVADGADDPPYVGFGFYGKRMVHGKTAYRAIWLHKVKFGEPADENETEGDSPSFKTPSLEGVIMTDILGRWKTEVTVKSPELAVKWLNGRALIAAPDPPPDPPPGS